jgi:hypothetical protein
LEVLSLNSIMDDIDRKDVLFGIYQRGLENAPWLKDIPSDEKDAMAKKVAGQVDSWLTSKSTHPYQRGERRSRGLG